MTYSDNRNYREYERMLVRLHALIAGGGGDSTEALELRQEMEALESQLSNEEMVRLNALSGDLSMLHDREIPDPDIVGRVPADEIPRQLIRAQTQRDWEKLLALLRTDVSRFLRPEQVAYLRSRAYEALNELAPAVAFMDEAARRVPASASFRALSMELLWKDERYQDAYLRANAYIMDAASSPRLSIMSGGIISRRAQHDHPPIDIKAVSAQAIERMKLALKDEPSAVIRFAGYGALGLLAARIGDQAVAETALKQTIDVIAETESQLSARGLVLDELELIRNGSLQSAKERSLARELADLLVPPRDAIAA
jgi:tetratricopeptide (TPR) repeat protein